jgi:ureidoglycolate dehydrogenase (NAD+)
MSNQFFNINSKTLEEYCKDLFVGYGLSEEDAWIVSKSLVDADLRNVISHGVVRVGNYVDRLVKGGANPKPNIKIISETPTTALIDADDCLGSVVSEKAVQLARKKAEAMGLAYIAVRKSNHYGAAGYWSIKLAGDDMFGISGSNVEPIVCITGGKTKALGNNPFSYAFPTKRNGILCFDAACSVVAAAKKFEYQRLGKPMPEGWFLDDQGKPATDAAKATLLLPFGGYKGYGLAVVVEMMSSVIAGGNIGSEIGSQYDKLDSSNHLSHYFMAVNISAFRPLDEYKDSADKLIDYLHDRPKADGVEKIYVPGEIENRSKEQKLKDGLSIHEQVIDDLIALGKGAGLNDDRRAFLKASPVK